MANDLVPAEKLSPVMAALNERQRAFVENTFDPTIKHSRAECARRAGFTGDAETLAKTAWRLMGLPTIQAARDELSKRLHRDLAPHALEAVAAIIHDPTHKDRYKASIGVLHTIEPPTQRIDQTVTVEVDYSKTLINELRSEMRLPGVTEDFLASKYGRGPGGYYSMKAEIEAEERERQRTEANTIEGEYREITDEKSVVNDAHPVEPKPDTPEWMK